MRTEIVFPTVSLVLYMSEALVYANQRDFRGMFFWLAAAILTAYVTY